MIPDGTHWQIGTFPLFQSILADLRQPKPVSDISRRFHAGLAATFVDLAQKIREQTQLNRVCLSGGCFHNILFFRLLLDGLRAQSFEVYFHSEVPAGDGGISLGQALIAAHRAVPL